MGEGGFPILRGRLLKGFISEYEISGKYVSNPWREAIED